MANLLPDRAAQAAVSDWPAARLQRFARRLRDVQRLADSRLTERTASSLAEALADFAADPSALMLDALLETLATVRGQEAAPARVADEVGPGRLLIHWFGRGLGTGEAEVASRGLFDGEDRPPLGSWIEPLERPAASAAQPPALGVVVWVPESLVRRATAGIEAEPRGALAWLGDEAPALAERLAPIVDANTGRRSGQSFST